MWGIIMEPGKKYSTVVENTFHLSMAVLDLETVKKGENDIHTVYVETDDSSRMILCHLSKAFKLFQCRLDHVFTRGTDLKFVTSGSANIHMTGYLDVSEEDEFNSDMESLTEEEETPILKKTDKGNKRKADDIIPKKSKALKLDENSDDNEDSDDEIMDFEDNSDDEEEGIKLSDLIDDEAESCDEEEDDDLDDEDDEEDDEAEDEPVFTKKIQKAQQTPKKQVNGNEQKTPKNAQKTPKGQEKTPKVQEKTPKAQEKTPKGQKTPKLKTPDANKSLPNGNNESSKKNKESKTPLGGLKTKPDTPLPKDKQNQQQKLNGGVIIHDLKVGDGAVAKPGKNVKVYYIGRLKSTGKVFDSMQKGGGFTFGLQRGEVIKGWDVGIAGMKVGGKRKVICPPNMAYGAKGSPPEIPPNSTLVFEVELKHVN